MVLGALRKAAKDALLTVPTRTYKASVLGAGGGIGQPTSLLLKMNPMVSELSLYDMAGTEGVAADVSHLNTPAKTLGFEGEERLAECLKGSDIVVIPAGVPRKPGMTRDDLFKVNAGIVASLVRACGTHCPNALINLISNPVNSTIPVAAEVLKSMGVYDKRKLFGVSTLDVVRAKAFLAETKGFDPYSVDVPVVGGHAGKTILPLFSQASPKAELGEQERDALTKRTMEAGTEVVNAKGGKGSATLSMAYAAAYFADSCLRAKAGEGSIKECAYVDSNVTDLPYFASKVSLGPDGAETVHPLGELDEYEKNCHAAMKEELSSSIQRGIDFAHHELDA